MDTIRNVKGALWVRISRDCAPGLGERQRGALTLKHSLGGAECKGVVDDEEPGVVGLAAGYFDTVAGHRPAQAHNRGGRKADCPTLDIFRRLTIMRFVPY